MQSPAIVVSYLSAVLLTWQDLVTRQPGNVVGMLSAVNDKSV